MDFQRNNSVSLIYKNLKKGDYEVRPFQAYKNWYFASDDSDNFLGKSTYFKTVGIDVFRALYPENNKYFGGVANLSSSIYERSFTTQSLDPKLIWYYLDHTYYDNFNKDSFSPKLFGNTTKTNLWESSSVVIVPQRIFGERVKPGSVTLTNNSSDPNHVYILKDDSNGNLIDGGYDTSKIIDEGICILNLGFNEQYRSYEFRNKQTQGPIDYSNLRNEIVYVSPKKISYGSGIPTASPVSSSGTAIELNGGYLRVVDKQNFDMSARSNFAISFWVNVPPSQSNISFQYNSILNKNTIKLTDSKNRITGQSITEFEETFTPHYPFDVKINNYTAGDDKYKVIFGRSSGIAELNLMSTTSLPTGSWTHVLCQKSGSVYGIYLNGILDVSTTLNIDHNVSNEHEMYIGGNGTQNGIFSGSLDEIRIYGGALNPTQISALADNSYDLGYAYQTNVVGNVFYSDGIMVISDPRPKYWNALLGRTGNYDYSGRTDGFSAQFKSTATLYEHEIICKIKKSEFNLTTNPTIINGGVPHLDSIKGFVTSSFFNPYFTTIGFYNDNYELLAIAKTTSPIEKRDDVDLNVIVRWDV